MGLNVELVVLRGDQVEESNLGREGRNGTGRGGGGRMREGREREREKEK